MKSRFTPFLLLATLTLAACGAPDPQPTAGGSAAGCMTRAYSEIGGPFRLMDETGAEITEADFLGRPSLVFFGFTQCPDVCPMTLYTLGQAIEALPEGTPAPRTVLITVDPERDTPQALATYISNDAFPDDIKGLTGSPEAIREAATVFRADFSRVDLPESQSGYTMDHTSLIYLMDETWSMKTFFTHADDSESIAQCLAQHLG